MPNSQLNQSKSQIKYGTEVTLNLSSNVTGDSYDETNFPHKLSVTDRHVQDFVKLLQIIHQLMK